MGLSDIPPYIVSIAAFAIASVAGASLLIWARLRVIWFLLDMVAGKAEQRAYEEGDS